MPAPSIESRARNFGFVFRHLPGVLHSATGWVDLARPDLVSCDSPETCDGLLKTVGDDKAVNMSDSFLNMVLDIGGGNSDQCVKWYPDREITHSKCTGTNARTLCQVTCAPAPAPPSCPILTVSITDVGGMLYAFNPVADKALKDARRYCTDRDMDLAKINNLDEYNNLRTFMGGSFAIAYDSL